ncbi:hypothetical protein GGR53DRAFT_505164 [Hypoxylon sp. FL1150]|nr:hypothetical protein GGR53DRAFT_505164 [Hypoxylon sp. FL1150]
MPPIRLAATPSRHCLSPIPSSTPFSFSLSQTPIYAIPASASRSIHATTPLHRQKPSHLTVPEDLVPAYPYGPFRTYKQANEGLFAGTKVRFGNVVAAKYGNKSRHKWYPNQHTKRLWSPSLNGFIRTRMTARVLRTIDLLGGIDEYLLGGKARRIKDLGPAGWALRWKIMQTPAVRERFARERAKLGLPPKEEGTTFPQELSAEGLTAEAVLDEVDGMLERGDEFVLGEAAKGEEVVVQGDAEVIKGVKETAGDAFEQVYQDAKPREDTKTATP